MMCVGYVQYMQTCSDLTHAAVSCRAVHTTALPHVHEGPVRFIHYASGVCTSVSPVGRELLRHSCG
jgi:hypothetical protein